MNMTRAIIPTTLLVFVAVACGTNECDDACAKIEECNPGSVCTVDGDDCSGQALELAECINDATCAEVGACILGTSTGSGTGVGTGTGAGTPAGTGTGTGSGSGAVTTCAALCDLAPTSTPIQDGCVADFIVGLGYPTETSVACNLLSVQKTIANCNACYDDIDVTDEHCAAAHAACF